MNKKELNKLWYEKNKIRILDNEKKDICIDCGKKCIGERCWNCNIRFRNKHEYNIGEKIKLCKCGCGNWIVYKRYHLYLGIPNYINRHHPSWCKGLTKETHEGIKRTSIKKIGNKWNLGRIKVIYEKRFCKYCDKELSRNSIRRRFIYCSKICAGKDRERNLIKLNCSNCRKEIYKKEFNILNNNFCSKGCFSKYISNKLKGTKKDEEFKKKCRENRSKQKFPLKDSSIEVKIQRFLTKLRIEYVAHKYMNIAHSYLCDIFIPIQKGITQKTIIECDGDYWHGNKERFKELNNLQLKQIEKDKLRNKELTEQGYRVIRLWEKDIKKMRIKGFSSVIKQVREIQEVLSLDNNTRKSL